MVDQSLGRVFYWIRHRMLPEAFDFLAEMFKENIFTKYTPEEIQFYCLKLAVEALILLVCYRIGCYWADKKRKKERKNKQAKLSKTETVRKPFKPKKWSPTGWYWDEEKEVWVAPDYLSQESKDRWKWDEQKRIWIDLTKEKE